MSLDGTMILQDTPENLKKELDQRFPTANEALYRSRCIHKELLPYQAAALYGLAQRFNVAGAEILEIGTLAGYSASIMAQAAPKAHIVTLNIRHWEVEEAKVALMGYKNIDVKEAVSWEYLAAYKGTELDFIFVDGNHNRVAKDVGWFNWLKPGGLMVFHDYSPLTSSVVYDTINLMIAKLGRQLDIMVIDTNKIGMAGIMRRGGEKCPL